LGGPYPLGDVLTSARNVSRSDAAFTWVDEPFLLGQGVSPWTGLPLWIPLESGGSGYFSNRRARAAGLTFRPLEDTIRDTLNALPQDKSRADTLTRDQERNLLTTWHADHRG